MHFKINSLMYEQIIIFWSYRIYFLCRVECVLLTAAQFYWRKIYWRAFAHASRSSYCCPGWAIALCINSLSSLTIFFSRHKTSKITTDEKFIEHHGEPSSNLIEVKLCALPFGIDHIMWFTSKEKCRRRKSARSCFWLQIFFCFFF